MKSSGHVHPDRIHPNPATLKFLPGREVMGEGAVADFPSAEQAHRSPLAKALFTIPEVSRVFFGSDFISVTKRDGDWKHLKPAILGAVMEHFTQGLPLLEGGADEAEETFSDEDSEVVAQIKELIEPACAPRWRRMAATSFSKLLTVPAASFPCICKVPARDARPPP